MPHMVYVGDRLRELRTRQLLTQEELAEKAGIHPLTVVGIEGNRQEPHFRTIRRLAQALGVEPQELTRKED